MALYFILHTVYLFQTKNTKDSQFNNKNIEGPAQLHVNMVLSYPRADSSHKLDAIRGILILSPVLCWLDQKS